MEETVACDIRVYGADWCSLTRRVREYLMNVRLDYDYCDVDREDEAKRFVAAVNDGHQRFPVVVVEHEVVAQPTIAALQRAIAEHGLEPEIRTVRLPATRAEETPVIANTQR